jgi:lipoprotein-releasing system permease protein
MANFSSYIAKRYLWSKRSEAFISILTIISILGVAIGVAVLNITMSIMTGFETTLKEKIVGANSHITVRRVGGALDNWEQILKPIKEIKDIKNVAPFTYNQALLKVENKSVGILLRGISENSPSFNELVTDLPTDPTAINRMFNPDPVTVFTEDGSRNDVVLPGVIIGKELSVSYGLSVGDIVSFLSSQVSSTPMGLVPKFKRFVVAGVYSSGLIEYESGVAYIPLKEAQSFFKLGSAVSGLEITINDFDKSKEVTQKITDLVNGNLGGSPIYAQDSSEQNKPLWEAIKMEKRVYFIVLMLLVVLASFSIISTLVMIVLEKRKDIAVLKTLGASDSSIAKIFRTQGAVIGIIGTTLGLLLGFIGCMALKIYGFPLDERIFQMSQVPVTMDPVNFTIVGVCSFLICYLSTWYPSKRAASLHPSEILRGA